jgi:hypothetical protein
VHPLAARRSLRLALATSLCLCFAMAWAWPLSYVAPIVTVMVLSRPIPALRPAQGAALVVAMLGPMLLGMMLLPFLWQWRWVGVGLLGLALFYVFLFAARGGAPLLATCMTIGLTIVVTVGSVSPLLLTLLLPGLAAAIVCAVVFTWIGHWLIPDPPTAPAATAPAASTPPTSGAGLRALRVLFVVLPLAMLFLFFSGSPTLTPVMIKSAMLAQQSTSEAARRVGLAQMLSTFWGGAAAVLCWQLLAMWPSLLVFGLFTALLCLVSAVHIFCGPGLHRRAGIASYAIVTYLILIAPSVTDSPLSNAAGDAFQLRLMLFAIVTVYATLAVRIFDAFWPTRSSGAALNLRTG